MTPASQKEVSDPYRTGLKGKSVFAQQDNLVCYQRTASLWLLSKSPLLPWVAFPLCHKVFLEASDLPLPSTLWPCGLWPWVLTHPDFPKLPGSKFLLQLEGFPRDLPGIFLPRLLGLGRHAGHRQFLAEPITPLWNRVPGQLRATSTKPASQRLLLRGRPAWSTGPVFHLVATIRDIPKQAECDGVPPLHPGHPTLLLNSPKPSEAPKASVWGWPGRTQQVSGAAVHP